MMRAAKFLLAKIKKLFNAIISCSPAKKGQAGPRDKHASDESRAAQNAHRFDLHELQKLINRDHF
ncbi:hypothetical protein ACLM45_08400 [Synechococcus sp. A10-1-5-9]|uniref:hypothetical protein n=1 Tax=Synechococcus sp. A10-1-5-9 TaxID=3392295 RepID=UPI0039EBDA33